MIKVLTSKYNNILPVDMFRIVLKKRSKFDRPKDEIFLLCNNVLTEKLNEIRNEQKANGKLLKMRVYTYGIINMILWFQ